MALPQPALGDTPGRRTTFVDPERCRAYALATNDPNPRYLEGLYAPPVFGVVPTWDVSMETINTVVSPQDWPMLLHVEQDMRFPRPMVPGMALQTGASIYSVRVIRSGTWVTVHIESVDDDERLVLEQFSSMFIRKMKAFGDIGPERPDHKFPDAARSALVAEVARHVDEDQTFRYAEASGDSNRIHVDDGFAKSVNLQGIIIHGLCTMAMCGSVVIDAVAGGDPSRLARLAVRFSRPVFPGSDLAVSVYEAAAGEYAFEAAVDGKLVVRDGRAEVRD
ncbi:MAG: MaoC/PaaZ C-terminal domain-containing protein [Acidimicrobiales bacterium]